MLVSPVAQQGADNKVEDLGKHHGILYNRGRKVKRAMISALLQIVHMISCCHRTLLPGNAVVCFAIVLSDTVVSFVLSVVSTCNRIIIGNVPFWLTAGCGTKPNSKITYGQWAITSRPRHLRLMLTRYLQYVTCENQKCQNSHFEKQRICKQYTEHTGTP